MKGIVNDVCDVVFKRLSDGKIAFTAEAQLSSVSQKITENKIKAGIGNKTIAVLRSDKEIELNVRNGIFTTEFLEMSSGLTFNTETNTIWKKEEGLVSDGSSVTITGTPKVGGKIKVIGSDGATVDGTYATGEVTFTGGVADKRYTVIYEFDATNSNALKLTSDSFSQNYQVEYSTVVYDPETNEILSDLYLVFNSATPAGDWNLSFENGKPLSQELKFTCLSPIGSNEIGKIIEVKRA
jgi:glucose dehydrogenase